MDTPDGINEAKRIAAEQMELDKAREEEARRAQQTELAEASKPQDLANRELLLRTAREAQKQLAALRAKGVAAAIEGSSKFEGAIAEKHQAIDSVDAQVAATTEQLQILRQALGDRQVGDPSVMQEVSEGIARSEATLERCQMLRDRLDQSLAKSEGRDVTDEDKELYNALSSQIEEINGQIEQIEYLEFYGHTDDASADDSRRNLPNEAVLGELQVQAGQRTEESEPVAGEAQERYRFFQALSSEDTDFYSRVNQEESRNMTLLYQGKMDYYPTWKGGFRLEIRKDFLEALANKFYSLELNDVQSLTTDPESARRAMTSGLREGRARRYSTVSEEYPGSEDYYFKGRILRNMAGIGHAPDIEVLASRSNSLEMGQEDYGGGKLERHNQYLQENFGRYLDILNFVIASYEGSGKYAGDVVPNYDRNSYINSQLQRFNIVLNDIPESGPIIPDNASEEEAARIREQFAGYKDAARQRVLEVTRHSLKEAEDAEPRARGHVEEAKKQFQAAEDRELSKRLGKTAAEVEKEIAEKTSAVESTANQISAAEKELHDAEEALGKAGIFTNKKKLQSRVSEATSKLEAAKKAGAEAEKEEKAIISERDEAKKHISEYPYDYVKKIASAEKNLEICQNNLRTLRETESEFSEQAS